MSSTGTMPTQSWEDQTMMWVLMSILYGGGENGAELAGIISASDYINHAVISFTELQAGLNRLHSLGVIRKKDSRIYFTASFWKQIAEIEARTRSLHKKWRGIEAVLAGFSGKADRHGAPCEKIFFSEEEVQQSIEEYLIRNQVR